MIWTSDGQVYCCIYAPFTSKCWQERWVKEFTIFQDCNHLLLWPALTPYSNGGNWFLSLSVYRYLIFGDVCLFLRVYAASSSGLYQTPVQSLQINSLSSQGTQVYLPEIPWWCHDVEMVSALLALCEGNLTVNFQHKGSVMLSFDFLLVVILNKLLSSYLSKLDALVTF